MKRGPNEKKNVTNKYFDIRLSVCVCNGLVNVGITDSHTTYSIHHSNDKQKEK